MTENRDTCSKCGKKSVLKGDIGLRNSKTMDLVVVVRQDHGVEKNVPLKPRICGGCGSSSVWQCVATAVRDNSKCAV